MTPGAPPGVLATVARERLGSADPTGLSDPLERGQIVHFPVSPVPFPPEGDLRLLRELPPAWLARKNISYHPEAGRVVGLHASREILEHCRRILLDHSRRVQAFLEEAVPFLTPGWKVGTSSFRPIEEKGRDLPPRASNERVHVDAGAYGATHGDRILRFFMNANAAEDRVWVTKGTLPQILRRYGAAAGLAPRPLGEGAGNRLYTAVLSAASRWGLPMARLLDTSPYDRAMRRLHNFMKESEELQGDPEGHAELRFKPRSAWMVFTDAVSHACVSGRHAFIDTFIVPLKNCRFPAMAPFHVLQSGSPPRLT